ncbi:MAG: cation:proton antiporter [Thermoleophilaceae bacterium]
MPDARTAAAPARGLCRPARSAGPPLLLFLPPLLYSAAFFSSLRDLRDNLPPISLLAVGLVLVTTVAVAATAHFLVDGMSWPAAFVLGAIVSPTDPVAATTIARRLGIPRRIVTVVEGEALVNDGTALIAYRFALAAVATGTFSLFDAGLTFVLSAVGGAARPPGSWPPSRSVSTSAGAPPSSSPPPRGSRPTRCGSCSSSCSTPPCSCSSDSSFPACWTGWPGGSRR